MMAAVLENMSTLYAPIYNRFVRNHLPRKWTVLNGVVTKGPRLLDPNEWEPNHKDHHVDLINSHIHQGDEVVEIGAGYGVCTIWAARQGASVTSFEASAEMIEIAKEAVAVNSEIHRKDLSSRIDLRHALIGSDIDVWGSSEGAKVISPEKLPSSDVLILDCEGAEKDIVPCLVGDPSRAIIEVHPDKGANPRKLQQLFHNEGYETRTISDGETTIIFGKYE